MKKEKYLWAGITSILMIFIMMFSFSPFVSAQNFSGGTTAQYTAVFEELMKFIKNNYIEEVDEKTLFEGAMKGMFESLGDPYSVYLTEKDMNELSDTTTGHFGGVGLYISKYYGDTSFDRKHLPYVRVVAPIEDTPAYRLNISAGDYIIKVENKSTENMPLDEVTNLLRGVPGTVVNVTFLRGDDIVFTLPIERAVIEVPTVKRDFIGKDIGYLRIIQFTPNTAEKVKEVLSEFDKKRIKSLIIDLRNNPGGTLSSVTQVADFFLKEGVIVSTKSKVDYENRVYRADKKTEISPSVPIVVLIDRGSASASEILAAALSDNSRGVLVGETTYGKGSVQQVRLIGSGGFKLTMSKYYTPSDKNIDKIGIAPFKEIKEKEFTEDEAKSYKILVEEFRIQKFIKENAAPSDADINDFIEQLKKENIVLENRIIIKMIHNEINKTNNDPPVYDLEFDTVLQEAVRMLRNGEVKIK